MIYGNSVTSWATALAVIVVVALLLSALKRLVLGRIARLAERTPTSVDNIAVRLLRGTRLIFLALVSIAVVFLVVDVTDPVRRVLRWLAIVAVLVQIANWGNAAIGYWFTHYAARRGTAADPGSVTTMNALSYVARFALWVVLLLVALDTFGMNITALVTGLGITGIAVALAVQNILGDLFAALSIVLDKPFVVGDHIEFDSFAGTVEHIGLKSTRIRSVTGELIIASNGDLLRGRIRNFRNMRERRAILVTRIPPDTGDDAVARVPELMQAALDARRDARLEHTHLRGVTDSALEFETVYFVTTADQAAAVEVQEAVLLQTRRVFAAAGVRLLSQVAATRAN
ncbi:MAG: mechanosensitive ion channel family protein [Gemmatimonadaceae bacterium]